MSTLNQAREVLSSRQAELNKFLSYLLQLETAILESNHENQILPSTDVTAMMKSAILIMNYSVAEATIVEIIDEVFCCVKSSGVSFKKISQGVRKQLISYKIKNLKSADDVKIESFIDDALRWVMEDSAFWLPDKLTIREAFLGNLDAQKIRLVTDQMEVPIRTSRRTRNGSDLKEMKDSRNQLAHGYRSFVELGQLKSVRDLKDQTKRIAEFLLAVIRAFEKELRAGRIYQV